MGANSDLGYLLSISSIISKINGVTDRQLLYIIYQNLLLQLLLCMCSQNHCYHTSGMYLNVYVSFLCVSTSKYKHMLHLPNEWTELDGRTDGTVHGLYNHYIHSSTINPTPYNRI